VVEGEAIAAALTLLTRLPVPARRPLLRLRIPMMLKPRVPAADAVHEVLAAVEVFPRRL
jgi:hypothetical protein